MGQEKSNLKIDHHQAINFICALKLQMAYEILRRMQMKNRLRRIEMAMNGIINSEWDSTILELSLKNKKTREDFYMTEV